MNRSNVTKSPKDNFNECEDFFFTVVRAHMVAASMQVLGMASLHEPPKNYVFPDIHNLSPEQRQGILMTPARDIVSKFFNLGLHSSKCHNIIPFNAWLYAHMHVLHKIPQNTCRFCYN